MSRSEFVDKPNPFFVKYDRKRECRVTFDTIMDVVAESEKSANGRAVSYGAAAVPTSAERGARLGKLTSPCCRSP